MATLNLGKNIRGKKRTEKIGRFTADTVTITVHIVKYTGTNRNFSNATMNYPSAVFFCVGITFL